MMHMCHMAKSFNYLLPVMFVNYNQTNGQQRRSFLLSFIIFNLLPSILLDQEVFPFSFKGLCLLSAGQIHLYASFSVILRVIPSMSLWHCMMKRSIYIKMKKFLRETQNRMKQQTELQRVDMRSDSDSKMVALVTEWPKGLQEDLQHEPHWLELGSSQRLKHLPQEDVLQGRS